MQSPELISIQKYAARHHISIFSVIKKTMSGELPTVVREENGKEVTYIAMNESTAKNHTEAERTNDDDTVEIDYKKAYEDLNKEYLILKTKYQKMVEMLEG